MGMRLRGERLEAALTAVWVVGTVAAYGVLGAVTADGVNDTASADLSVSVSDTDVPAAELPLADGWSA